MARRACWRCAARAPTRSPRTTRRASSSACRARRSSSAASPRSCRSDRSRGPCSAIFRPRAMRAAPSSRLPEEMEAHLGRILDAVPPDGVEAAGFGALGLTSRYQPIYSATQHAIHGYEGLLVALDQRGRTVPPLRLFERTANLHDRLHLDWLARALHLRGFSRLGEDRGRLFLNVTPHAAIEDARHAGVFVQLLEQYGVRPDEVVVEILESAVDEEVRLAEAVRLYKTLGCAVALDDFGAGVSEME